MNQDKAQEKFMDEVDQTFADHKGSAIRHFGLRLSKDEIIYHYHKQLLKALGAFRDSEPKFRIGDIVMMKADAKSLYFKKWDVHKMKPSVSEFGMLWAGIDKIRVPMKRRLGTVIEISRITASKEERPELVFYSRYSYMVRFSEDKIISMVEEWLEPVKVEK